MSTKLDFIFVIPPFLHNKGVSLGTSYDLNYRLTSSINSTNFKYASINFNLDKSNKITTDLEFIEKKAKEFEKNYEGKIHSLNGSSLLRAIEKLEIIDERMDKILSYAYLLYAENIEAVTATEFIQIMDLAYF